MALQDILSQLSLCVTCVDPDNGYVFGIRIHKGPEYGSIWIRIYIIII